MINREKIRELIIKHLTEISATGTGASTTPGEGMGVSTKMGFKRVNRKELNRKAKGIEVKQLQEENSKFDVESFVAGLNTDNQRLKQFITKRLLDFDIIEDNLTTIIELLKRAKLKTIQSYEQEPNYTYLFSTDLVKDSLEEILTLLKQNENTPGTV